jgi:putative DNA primase/helicase
MTPDEAARHAARAQEIARLAALPPLDYEREREAAAKTLGIRVSALDNAVRDARSVANPGDDGKQGTALNVPDRQPAAEPQDGAQLLHDIEACLRRHVVLSPHSACICALWIAHTYLIDGCTHSPRLAIQSAEKGSGKTTLLDLVGELVQRPLGAAGITSAALFRTIAAAHPTLLLDEYDSYLRDNEDLRGILNAGHKRGGAVIRCVGDDAEPRQFACFGPIAMAGIGALPGTVQDRSLVIRMQRAAHGERPVRILRRDKAAMEALASRLARWAEDSRDHVEEDPDLPEWLGNWVADNWRLLFAIANAAGGAWPARLRAAALALAASPDDDAVSHGVRLLADLRTIFGSMSSVQMASADICAQLVQMEDRPWPESRGGKPITPPQLAALLRPYGIQPATIRQGIKTAKGYYRKALEDAWQRYLAPNGPEGVAEPSHRHNQGERPVCGENGAVTPEAPATRSVTRKPAENLACDGVTAETTPLGPDGGWRARI